MPPRCCSLKLESARWDCLAATTFLEPEAYSRGRLPEAAASSLKEVALRRTNGAKTGKGMQSNSGEFPLISAMQQGVVPRTGGARQRGLWLGFGG